MGFRVRAGAQVDMCHFGLVGGRVADPSNFQSTKVAPATTRAPLLPLMVRLNAYCNLNAPPWFTWCSIQIVRPEGSEAMGLHADLRDGAPMAPIVCVRSFTGVAFWVESGGLLNIFIRDKKRHTRVHKGSEVQGWARIQLNCATPSCSAPKPGGGG